MQRSAQLAALIFLALASATPAKAQLGFVTGLMFGAAMNNSSHDAQRGNGPGDVLYMSDTKKPIDIRNVHAGICRPKGNNAALFDCFAQLVTKVDDWEVLEIRAIPAVSSGDTFFLRFVYQQKGM